MSDFQWVPTLKKMPIYLDVLGLSGISARNPINLWKSDQKTYLFTQKLILFFLFLWEEGMCTCVSALYCANPPSSNCESGRFGAYKVEFFNSKIITKAIIMKNCVPSPHGRVVCSIMSGSILIFQACCKWA